MKRNRTFYFFVFILVFGVAACMPREEETSPVQQEPPPQKVSRETAVPVEATPDKETIRKGNEKLARRLEESRALLELALSGMDENVTYVRLTPENDFTDRLSEDLSLTRDATSGPGTGKFTGEGFEFTEGACVDPDELSAGGKQRILWRKRIFKCKSKILEDDWCARLKDNPAETYTLTFLSWLVRSEECVGNCEEHDNSTAYVRVKHIDE